jgi:hypothetical protein
MLARSVYDRRAAAVKPVGAGCTGFAAGGRRIGTGCIGPACGVD